MKPTIDFHDIVSIRLTPIESFDADEKCRHAFANRDIVLTDAEGKTFRVGLFAENEKALLVIDDEQARACKPLPVCAGDGKGGAA